MSSDAGDWTCLQPGFPIRKSSDHSLVIDSPRLIADSYVLHRFLVPRHPPCALKNLTTKMLASTVQFSKHQPHNHTTTENHSMAVMAGPQPRNQPHGRSLRHPTAHHTQHPTNQTRFPHTNPKRDSCRTHRQTSRRSATLD